MSKLKKIVLFVGIGVILLAVAVITAVSWIRYQTYRKQFGTAQKPAYVASLPAYDENIVNY